MPAARQPVLRYHQIPLFIAYRARGTSARVTLSSNPIVHCISCPRHISPCYVIIKSHCSLHIVPAARQPVLCFRRIPLYAASRPQCMNITPPYPPEYSNRGVSAWFHSGCGLRHITRWPHHRSRGCAGTGSHFAVCGCGVWGCQGAGVRECRSFGVLEFGGAGVWEYRRGMGVFRHGSNKSGSTLYIQHSIFCCSKSLQHFSTPKRQHSQTPAPPNSNTPSHSGTPTLEHPGTPALQIPRSPTSVTTTMLCAKC